MSLPKDCYYHGLTNKSVVPDNIKQRLELSYVVLRQILEDGVILSRQKQGIKQNHYYNSDKQICLCKDLRTSSYEYAGHKDILSGYLSFVQQNFSIIISKYLIVKKPSIMSETDILNDWYEYGRKIKPGKYSNMYDEYRVENEIKSDKFIGIGVPFFYNYLTYYDEMSNIEWFELIKDYYYQIVSLLIRLDINIPIFDTETKERIECLNDEFLDSIQKKILTIKNN